MGLGMELVLTFVLLSFSWSHVVGSNARESVTVVPADDSNSPEIVCSCSQEEPVETVTSVCSVSGEDVNFGERTEEALISLRMGDVVSANYYFAKIDESPEVTIYLRRIIKENYKSSFNATMEFISSIFIPSLRLNGYDILLENLLSQDVAASQTRQNLFRLALTLRSQGENENYSEEEDIQIFLNVTSKFPQGIRTTVFYPHFVVKNIHDSYVFQYKLIDSDYWGFTGKCNKNCNKSHLVALPNEDFSLFTIKSASLLEGDNCLGVKDNATIFWTHNDVRAECPYERWHIKFVGKTLTMLIYQPLSSGVGSDMRNRFKGFALTRTGYNQRTQLGPTTFLNSYQIWLTT